MRATPYAMLYIVPALLSLILAIYGWRRRQRSGALPFSMLAMALAVWCACHAASVASTSFAGVLFWAQVQYAGIVSVGPCWALFALAYAGRERRATPWLRMFMLVIALLTYAAVLTNSSHFLWWSQVTLALDRPFGSLDVVRGPLFWVHIAFAYSYILGGMFLFIHRALNASRFYHRQALLVIVGASIPFVGNLVMLLGVRLPLVDDPTPFLLLFSCILLFYASLRYQLLNLAPIAQREVFESIPDGVIVIDQRGVVSAVNSSGRALLPADHRDPVGQTLTGLLEGSPFEVDLQHMQAHSRVPQSRRIIYRNTAGALSGVELRLQPLYERGGAHAGSVILVRDTSEQVRAEHTRDQRLREVSLLQHVARTANSALETEDVLCVIGREMLKAIPWQWVAVGLLEPDGETLRLTADQHATYAATLQGRLLDTYTFGAVLELMQSGQPYVLHVTDPLIAGTLTETGLRRLGLQTVLCLPLASRDQQLGMLFVGNADERSIPPDELRLFEALGALISDTIVRTRLYEAAQEASQLKSAFLATVSHELRTPLTSVTGFADMLQSGMFGNLSNDSGEAVAHIQRGSQLLLRLINDILDFSKMEAGHFNVDLYPVDAALVMKMVTGAMHPQLYERGLTLTLDIPDDTPLVQANSARLEQVLTNLVANAIKFTEHGTITISANRIGARVRLSVRDSGIGIAPADLHRVFDAFHQIESPLTRRYGGTGLGLAISKRLVELMGGTISLESTVGVGSIFHVDLHAAVFETLRDHAVVEERAHATPYSAPQQ